MTRPIASSFTGSRWEPELGIVFSSREGFVWASWPDTDAAVRLGDPAHWKQAVEDRLKAQEGTR